MNTILSYIQNANQVAILTHQSPDGDAMGSSLAMYHFIKSLGKEAQVLVPNAFPDFLAWMPGADAVLLYDAHKAQADAYLEAADLIVCTDFNAPNRIGSLGDKILTLTCPKVMIDHHLHPDNFVDAMISVPEASSTCELVYGFLMNSSSLSPQIATCLYTGLMTDTGNFSYNSNRPQIYPMIATLIEAGVNKDEIYNAVFNQYSVDRMKLVGYCLYQKMRVFPEHHAALIYLNRKELYRFNFQKGDAEGIVNMPLQSKDIYYSVFMREDKATPDEMEKNGGIKTKIKLSFRSQGDRPVNIFASEVFNGGGHTNASGGEYYGSLTEAVQLFLDNYAKYFKA
jgi:phosphoesterase RecJ-like protein